ncbi:uncharacterized protein TRUGW13939_09585 [Talaromyces rugulosus]|uniref:Mid2 domain-containing protein n=1 Tax=Talaromyces rugulosus TaxID=121627 RepID=A0A7H8R7Q7_TALRU|nr:uncharacterized protein TRUGW13939_09585 [Talaromyces rugulosus]QKX62424.1 hypothetical protein TRUGW13939_09585 [Talaromyces rugulosus]
MRSFISASLVAAATLCSTVHGVIITKPAAGDSVDTSQGFDIVWEYDSSDPLDWEIELGNPIPIQLLAVNVKPTSVASGQTAQYTYHVEPQTIDAGDNYYILLDARNKAGDSPESDEFTIADSSSSSTTTTLPVHSTSSLTSTSTTFSSSLSTSITSGSDIEQPTSTTSTFITTTTTTPAPNTATPTNLSSDTSPSQPSGALSTGTKAGIGVAIPVFVIILVLGILWYLRKRGKNKKEVSPEVGKESNAQFSPHNCPPNPNLAEADGNPVSELDSKSILPLQSSPKGTQDQVVYELSSDPTI